MRYAQLEKRTDHEFGTETWLEDRGNAMYVVACCLLPELEARGTQIATARDVGHADHLERSITTIEQYRSIVLHDVNMTCRFIRKFGLEAYDRACLDQEFAESLLKTLDDFVKT